jgi:hypothetical protein
MKGTLADIQEPSFCYRNGMYRDLSYKRALHADIWCAEGAHEIPSSHIWAYHGWGQQADRSTEAVKR